MTSQPTLFDIARTERDRVLDSLASNHSTYIGFVRAIAREIAVRTGIVTIDDVREALSLRDLPMPKDVGIDTRVFGTVFRSKEFEAVGERTTTRAAWAQRVGRNRSSVTIYRFREEAA